MMTTPIQRYTDPDTRNRFTIGAAPTMSHALEASMRSIA